MALGIIIIRIGIETKQKKNTNDNIELRQNVTEIYTICIKVKHIHTAIHIMLIVVQFPNINHKRIKKNNNTNW